ncbi:NifB/NifX family molybdenum-iron cluster-binding protein [Mycoplasmatota bacterium WC44]
MKVAVAVNNNNVSKHFGKTEGFMLFDIQNKEVISREYYNNSINSGCGITSELTDLGVKSLVVGGMGENAKRKVEAQNIEVYLTNSVSIEKVVEDFINGKLNKEDNLYLVHQHNHSHDDHGSKNHKCCGRHH